MTGILAETKNEERYALVPFDSMTVDPQSGRLHLTSFGGTRSTVLSVRDLLQLYNTAVDCLQYNRFKRREAELEVARWHRTCSPEAF